MRLHPLSAVTRALQRGLIAASFVVFLFSMATIAFPDATAITGLGFPLVPVAFLVGVAYQVAYYYRFDYALTPETVDITSGVFGRQEREIPYRRVQNVDITEGLFLRLLGMAVVRIETAGGSETEAELDFVSADQARKLQREIRERRAAVRDTTETPTDQAESEARVTDPTTVFSLGTGELLVLSLASFQVASVVFLIAGFPFVQSWLLRTAEGLTGLDLSLRTVTRTPDIALLAGVSGLVLTLVASWLVSTLVTFTQYYEFTLGRQGEDLVYDRGLLGRYSGSIPTDKIQTLTFTEPLLLRWLGYAGLTVETAGYSPGQNGQAGPQSAIPVAGRDRTLELARTLEPFEEWSFSRPPKRARRRYAVRYLLVVLAITLVFWAIKTVLGNFSLWITPVVLVPVVPVAAHLKWTHRGYDAGESYFVVRSGFWTRTTRIVPYYRLQTVVRERSIFQRRLGLAHLTADTATASRLGGRDATAFDIDADDAQRLYSHTRNQLQASLGLDER